ncbi:hypothetical protein ACFY4C_02435 [Actinomadura viridis]|uniref:hypothetical protein n=1 Tax=Actinomadura viridis TaxID=58110 RepID=UPI00368194A5
MAAVVSGGPAQAGSPLPEGVTAGAATSPCFDVVPVQGPHANHDDACGNATVLRSADVHLDPSAHQAVLLVLTALGLPAAACAAYAALVRALRRSRRSASPWPARSGGATLLALVCLARL